MTYFLEMYLIGNEEFKTKYKFEQQNTSENETNRQQRLRRHVG